MKKLIIFLFMLAGVVSLQAQTPEDKYKIEFEVKAGDTKPLLPYWFNCQIFVKIAFKDGSTYEYDWYLYQIPYTKPPAYYTSKEISSLQYSFYCYKVPNSEGTFTGSWLYLDSSDLFGSYTNNPCINVETQPFNTNEGNFDDYFIFKIMPNYWIAGSNAQILTDCNNILLTGNQYVNNEDHFIYSQCIWEYSIGSSGLWTVFNTGNKNASISGSIIPNFESIAGKQNVRVRYIYTCDGTSSNILTFSTMICGPELVSAEGISACGGSGQIKLTYSRPLYEDETLNFWVYDSSGDPQGIHYGWNDPDVTKNPEQNEVILSGLSPGTYTVRITSYLNGDANVVYTDDASGKYSIENIAIGVSPAPVIDKVETMPVSCPGSNDGTVTVTASSGSGSYYFKLYNYNEELIATSVIFQTTGTVSGLPPDTYDVYLFDSGGCEADGIKVATVDEPDVFEIDEVEMQSSAYNEYGDEAGDGWIAVSIYPYGQTYHFTWRAESMNGTILSEKDDFETSRLENISSGTYYVQVTNSSGCSIDSLIILPAGPKIEIAISQTGSIICSGDNTGQLEATVSGGTPPYQYTWYKIDEYTQQETLIPGAGGAVLSSITAGRYRLRVEDASGSKGSAIAIQTEDNPLTASFSTNPLNCSADLDGFLEIAVSGGAPPYSYAWENGATGTRIENLTAGNYGITVTDNAGCFKRFVGMVTGPSPLTMDVQVDQPSCSGLNNGRISLQVSGGNPPYSYTWNDGTGSDTRMNLEPGNYAVEVTDSKNCEILRREFTLFDPKPMVITLAGYQSITQFGLSNGKFSIKISGGNTPYSVFCMRNGSQSYAPTSVEEQGDGSWIFSYENLPEGEYTITATGNNYQADPLYDGCIATFQITVTEPPPLSVTIREEHPITCYDGNDGTLIADVAGGEPEYLYEWFRKEGTNTIALPSGQNTLSGLEEGIYIVKITDNNGVSASSPEYNLLSPDLLTLTFNTGSVTCEGGNNGQIEAVVTGGAGSYTYLWSTGETGPIISQKGSGAYSVTVTDRRGCQISGSAVIEPPESFDISYAIRPASCYSLNDGGVQLNVQGDYAPYTYEWSNGSNLSFAENLAPGEYWVVITDSKDCTVDLNFTIPEIEPISVTLTELKTPAGFGYSDGSIRVEITGGNLPYEVKWFNDEQELSAQADLTYEGEKAIAVLRNIPEGNYLLQVKDANFQTTQDAGGDPRGCLETQSFYVSQPPRLEVRIEQTHRISCNNGNDGALVSFVEGGTPYPNGLSYTYQWEKDGVLYETGTTGIPDIEAGAYRLKITDANGIEAWSETVTVNQPDPVVLQFRSADIKCSRDTDGWAEVSVTGGTAPYTYEWSSGDFTPRIENIPRGKYMVKVTDANQCQTTGVVEIVQANAIQVDAQLIQPSCFGGSDGAIHITLSKGAPPYTYYWENNRQTLDYTGLSKGSYTFTVTDVNGCGYEVVTFELGEPDQIFVDLGEDRELCKGQTLTIEAKIPEPAASFTWYNAAQKELFSGATYTLSDEGTYTVKAITAKGCTAYGSVTVTRDNREISADFIVATQVPINDEVFFVNIAIPAPESVEWILPESGDFEVITQNQQILSIIFHDYGTYIFAMRSYSGKCWETVYKTIRVMDKFDIDNYEDADESMLKSFTISPNPASQRFRVNIELKEDSPVNLYLINSGTGVVAAQKRLSGGKIYSEWFEVPAAKQGTYVISLVAPKARGVEKVILY